MSDTETEEISGLEDFFSNVKHLKSPQFFSQLKLNDLVYDLGLSKQAANLLTFQLNKKNLDRSAKVSHFKIREQIFVNVYSEVDSFVFFMIFQVSVQILTFPYIIQQIGKCLSIVQNEASKVSYSIMAIYLVLFQLVILFI